MSREKRSVRALLCALALAANGAGAFGQERVQQDADKVAAERIAQEVQITGGQLKIAPRVDAVGQGGEYSFTFIESELAFDSKVVKGAPFSADAVTESVQVLGDGNRITHTTTAKLYRDSDGRTRREQTLSGIGTWAASDDTPQTIFINDSVAGVNYVLNTKTRTAHKAGMKFSFTRTPAGGSGGTASVATTGSVAVSGVAVGGMGASGGGAAGVRIEPTSPVIRAGVLNGKAVKKVQPDYPSIARAAGAQGPVEVEVTVDEQGNVASAHAVSGHPLLQKAAVEAAGQWAFTPTQLQGRPTKVAGVITFNFALSGKDGEAAQGAAAQGVGVGEQKMRVAELTPGMGEMMVRVGGPEKLPRYPGTEESLGKQSFDGVQAEGTRTTVTIPVGAIGNERAIQIVSERWYSSELQTVVMTKHSDPRFGETTYRLTNISRNEPDHSLFEVPAGYNVIDRGDLERSLMQRKTAPPQK